MKKRMIALTLAALMTLSMAACGDNTEAPAGGSAENTVEASADDTGKPALSAKTEGTDASVEESAAPSGEETAEESVGTEESSAEAEPSEEEPAEAADAYDWSDPELWRTVIAYHDYEDEPEFMMTIGYAARLYLDNRDVELIREMYGYEEGPEFDEFMTTYEFMDMQKTIDGTCGMLNLLSGHGDQNQLNHPADESAAAILYEFDKLPYEEQIKYTDIIKAASKECAAYNNALREE